MRKEFISPDKWSDEITCRGMQNNKWIELGKREFKLSGCGKTFTITFFDLYKSAHVLDTLFSSSPHITCDCKHCGEPNYVTGKVNGQIDPRFLQQLPTRYNRFLKA